MHSLTFRVLLLFLAMAVPNHLWSQTTADVVPHETPSESATDSILPYPLTEINSAIEALDRQLLGISDALQPNSDLVRYQAIVNASQEYLANEQIRLKDEGNKLSNWQLDDVKREWNREKENLKALQEEVAVMVKWSTETTELLNIAKQRWNLTEEVIIQPDTPKEIVHRITTIIALVESVDIKLKARQNTVLSLENSITDALLGIDDLKIEMEKLRNEIESQVFQRDCPAIWNAFDDTLPALHLMTGLKQNLRNNSKFIEVFVYQNKNGVITQLLVLIGALLLLLYLRTQHENLHVPMSPNEAWHAKYLTTHFIGASLLIALVASGIIHSNIPTSVRELMLIGFLVGSILMIPLPVDRGYRLYATAIVFLFLLHELEFLIEGKYLLNRIILMAESLTSFAILYFVYNNKSKLLKLLEGVWWQFVWKVKYVLYGSIVASILANTFGYSNLAMLLTKITVYSLFLAIVLSVTQFVLHGTLVFLLHTKACNKSHLISQNHDLIKRKITSLLQYALVLVWVRATLISVGYYDSLFNWLAEILNTSWTIGSSTFSLKGILLFATIIVVSQAIAKSAKQLFIVEIAPRIVLPRGVPGAGAMLLSYFIGGIGLYMAISSTGIDLNKFSLIAGALSVGIGFGLQNIVHNFISGLILAFERPIQVGDTVAVGTTTGIVKNIGIRSSSISTFDGSEVILPNSDLIAKEVINWTLSNQTRRREIPVGTAYGTHPDKVLEVLRKVVREYPDVLSHPLPLCLFDGFGDSALKFRVLFWVPVDSVLTIQSNLGIAIYNALEEAGIEVPFPQHDIHIKSHDKSIDKPNPS